VWAHKFRGKIDPKTGRHYSARKVARLSKGQVDNTTVSNWWKEELPQRPPPEELDMLREAILEWEPSKAVPTLWDLLVKRQADQGLPAGISLALKPPDGTLMCKTLVEMVKLWALELGQQTKIENPGTPRENKAPFDTNCVAELSGNVVSAKTVRDFWREPVKQLSQQDRDRLRDPVVGWRPSSDGPTTLWAFLQRMRAEQGLPPGVLLALSVRRLSHWMWDLVRSWGLGMLKETDPTTGEPYVRNRVVALSGGLFSFPALDSWLKQDEPEVTDDQVLSDGSESQNSGSL